MKLGAKGKKGALGMVLRSVEAADTDAVRSMNRPVPREAEPGPLGEDAKDMEDYRRLAAELVEDSDDVRNFAPESTDDLAEEIEEDKDEVDSRRLSRRLVEDSRDGYSGFRRGR